MCEAEARSRYLKMETGHFDKGELMKKLRIIFFVVVLMTFLGITVSAAAYNDTLNVTNDTVGLSFIVKDNILTVSGMVDNEELQYIVITADKKYVLPISAEMKFKTEINLTAIESERVTLGVFLGKSLTEEFTSIFFGDDIVLEKSEGKYFFAFDDEVLEKNTEMLSGWVFEKEHINYEQPSAVKMITSNVIKGIETDYEKARAIHKWVAENIYYDMNYVNNYATFTPLTPVEVLTERRSVCEGYSNLTVAMLNSAGIPAFVTKGYALGVDAANSWKETKDITLKPNHAWVEAYVDGRWLIMDPTWDSYNKTLLKEKITEENPLLHYFDITPEMLSLKHIILERPITLGGTGVSAWAENEVKAAIYEGLVLETLYNSMKDSITRQEFCYLVINMLTVKNSKSIEQILLEKGVELNYDVFNDTADAYVLSANALGIVNGKGDYKFDPEGYITRQEAATMLYRTAKVMGVSEPNSEKLEFTDGDKFAEWGKEGIFFVSASLSKQGMRVMGGVENGKFDPQGFYTKEQSVLTIYRLFNTY